MNSIMREKLESSLIHEALFSEGFPHMAGILTPANFITGKKENGRTVNNIIWQCMVNLYPNTPISIITVHKEAKKSFDLFLNDFTNIHDFINCTVNPKYYCFLLLETDLRRNFAELIAKNLPNHINHTSVEDLKQIITTINSYSEDVFETIYKVEKYFESKPYEFETEFELVKEFRGKIDSRIHDLKQTSHIKTLLNAIDQLYNFKSARKTTLTCIVDILRYTMLSANMPEGTEEQIIQLRNSLFQ